MQHHNPAQFDFFRSPPCHARLSRVWLAALLGVAACTVHAAQPTPPAAQPPASAAQLPASAPAVRDVRDVRDVQLDAPVSKPAPAPAASPAASASIPTLEPKSTAAGWLFQLGANLLRDRGTLPGSTTNQVVSPVSLASALGLVHTGTAGAAADEISDLLAPPSARQSAFQTDLPALLQALQQETSSLAMANRVWVDASVAAALEPQFVQRAIKGYQADGAVLAFGDQAGTTATRQINSWAAQKTGNAIQELIPAGVLGADTRLVVTNGLRLQGTWLNRFDASKTEDKPFAGASKPVPTMHKFMELRTREHQGVRLYELALQDSAFSLVIGMDRSGQTGDAALAALALSLADAASWDSQACTVQMPRFKLAPSGQKLKTLLMELGAKTVFTTRADFTPLLGQNAKELALDEVIQAAGIEVNEAGIDAVAATAAVMVSRMAMMPNDAVCAIDRPFVFAVRHNASGTPVFMGRVVAP